MQLILWKFGRGLILGWPFSVQMGMEEKAFKLTDAVVKQIYENGLQSSYAWKRLCGGDFWASHYLRAMAIWAIYGVELTDFK